VSSADEVEPSDEAGEGAPEALAAKVEVLTEENRRLRAEYRRARKTEYRRTAIGFALLGIVALAGAVVFPGSREILLALSGTGLFAAVLVRSLTPERFIAAPVGTRVYEAHASTGRALAGDLGLSERRVYVPVGRGEDPSTVRLFVPQDAGVDPPDPEAVDVDDAFAVSETHRGLLVHPTGAGLYRDFEGDLSGAPAEDPAALGEQVLDALVDGFEMVDAGRVAAEDERLSIAVRGSVYGDVDGFDHPVASFVAVAVATTREVPVALETAEDEDGRYDGVVTCRWDT
jgi:hypothetical protein